MSARILIIDDETQLRLAVTRALDGHGFTTGAVADGASGLAAAREFRPDVVLLDLMLPDMSGVEVCREIRRTSATPIIVLSVVGDERTKVAALDQGADDYLTKPFGTDELLARIRVALRHAARSQDEAVFISGELTIDLTRRSVHLGEREIRLTPTEYALITYLATNAGRVLTHPMILRAVWGAEYGEDTQNLRTYINQLRSKLGDDAGASRYIRTEPGVGYRFLAPES
jgi:two-component system KDP operon response regulator KdpE